MALLDLDLDPDRRTLRRFGCAAFVVFGALAVAGATAWSFSGGVVAGLGALGVLAGAFAIAAPAANRPLYRLLTVLFHPVGLVVSYAVLAVLFFGVLTPVGLVFRLVGRDALRRRRDPGAASYWTAHARAEDVERYFRPF